MIFDTLDNIANYKGLGRVYDALEYIAKKDFSDEQTGRHDVDGDNIYYMVQQYQSRVGSTLSEAHKKYIDIQLVLEGSEVIGWAPIAQAGKAVEEKPENDYCLYECDTQSFTLTKGYFAVLYPSDVHLPGQALNDVPENVRKIVVKVLV